MKLYKCVRCDGTLYYEDQVSPDEPGEYLHDPTQRGVDDNDMARCPDGERGYPAPSGLLGKVFWHDNGTERIADLSELKVGHYIVNPSAAFWQGPFLSMEECMESWNESGKYDGERIVRVGATYREVTV